jgi:hypothetical protein
MIPTVTRTRRCEAAGDEVYGDNGPLRTWLEQQHIAHVLAVACDHRIPAGAGRTVRADHLAAWLPKRAWQLLSAGVGAKGHRHYDWARVTISHRAPGSWPSTAATATGVVRWTTSAEVILAALAAVTRRPAALCWVDVPLASMEGADGTSTLAGLWVGDPDLAQLSDAGALLPHWTWTHTAS